MKAYKGFDKDLKCRNHQFEVGKTYTHDGKFEACSSGYHACLNPIDVLNYYDPANSRFCEVELSGKTSTNNEDSKIAAEIIEIVREISVTEFVSICADYVVNNAKETESETGYYSAATNTGDNSAATNTGYKSAATNTGNYSAAEVSGNDSIACGLGYNNKARGSVGCWIVLAERNDNFEIISVKTAKVDGKKIKADTWYKLVNGKFVKA